MQVLHDPCRTHLSDVNENHLSKLEIHGYRGIDNLKLGDLADVNLIIGKNNVSKTSSFEALVLLGCPCLWTAKTRAM